MADIFVSYSRTDKARVAALVAAIEAHCLKDSAASEIYTGR